MTRDLLRVVVVGAATLKGRELKEVLSDRNFPALDTKLLDDDDALGQLDSVGEEATFVQSVTPEQFRNADFTFFTSDVEFTRKHWMMAQQASSAVVDLSYALEAQPEAVIRASWLERELKKPCSLTLDPAPIVIAHPAAVVLSLLLSRVQKSAPIRTAAATIFEPASERGKRGMDELHEQTVNLLSFKQLRKEVFGSQVAFNLLSRYGEKISPSLQGIADRILGHIRRIGTGGVALPSLMLLQAPTFHGHAFSIYIELEKKVPAPEFIKLLSGEHVVIASQPEDLPSNVNAAGQDHISVAARRDENRESGFWIWAAADNLRVAAINAVECAEAMISTRPRGRVQ